MNLAERLYDAAMRAAHDGHAPIPLASADAIEQEKWAAAAQAAEDAFLEGHIAIGSPARAPIFGNVMERIHRTFRFRPSVGMMESNVEAGKRLSLYYVAAAFELEAAAASTYAMDRLAESWVIAAENLRARGE